MLDCAHALGVVAGPRPTEDFFCVQDRGVDARPRLTEDFACIALEASTQGLG